MWVWKVTAPTISRRKLSRSSVSQSWPMKWTTVSVNHQIPNIGNAYWLTPWCGDTLVFLSTPPFNVCRVLESLILILVFVLFHTSVFLFRILLSGCLDRLESASMCCLNNPTNVGQHWSQHPQNLPPQKRDWVKLTETHGETHEHTHTHTNTQKRDWVKSTETHADADDWHSCDISTENRLVSGVGDNNSGAGKKDSQCRLCTIGGRHQPLFGNIFVISNHTNGGGHV